MFVEAGKGLKLCAFPHQRRSELDSESLEGRVLPRLGIKPARQALVAFHCAVQARAGRREGNLAVPVLGSRLSGVVDEGGDVVVQGDAILVVQVHHVACGVIVFFDVLL
jgi:hypothetical protein